MRAVLAAPLVAATFLSVIPLRLPRTVPPAAFPRAVGLFPLAGAGIGALVAVLDALARQVLPVDVSGAVALAALAVLTGGLHLDGLADAADGLLGPLERTRRLEVMREGGIGAFGAAAVALVLLVEFAALGHLAAASRVPALVGALALSRFAMSLAVGAFPYARLSGAGSAFKAGLGAFDVVVATAIAAIVAATLLVERGIALLLIVAVVALAVGAFARARLGGLTGDVYGAIAELAFAVSLIALVAMERA